MSKCDIQIRFDREDRTYRGGETVSGEVHIQVNKDIRCNGILLTHFWKTHGRGNRASGTKAEIPLSEMVPLQAGEELTLPFEFVADRVPLTYHGHYINVDHFVHVGVDVPWAIDPKHEEEYILLPGARPPGFDGGRGEVVKFDKPETQASGFGRILLWGIVGIFVVMMSIFLVFLIPVFLIAGGAYWIWKTVIASRVGKVELQVPHVVVGPGEKWPVELAFTPQKSFPVNGITLRLLAREAATSGSGTNKTTYRHTVFDEVTTLRPAGSLVAGERIAEQFVIDFPETSAWSFDESDNEVEWSAEVRIDIPRFPDWKQRTELQVVPTEFLDPVTIADSGTVGGSGAIERRSETQFSSDTERHSSRKASADEAADTGEPAEGGSPLVQIVNQVLAAGSFGNERSEIVAATEGQTFDLSLVIDRVSVTFGFTGEDERYDTGKTVIATIEGTEQEVQLFSVKASNDSLESVARGETWQTMVVVEGWDSLYDRLVLHEVPFD